MSTTLRPELAKNNKYYISKNRYYELKHLCLQYRELKSKLSEIALLSSSTFGKDYSEYDVSDPVFTKVCKIASVKNRIDIIDNCIKLLDPIIGSFVFKAVTEGLSYTYLRTTLNIPCCKDIYYEEYRKFFWLLDQSRK